MTVLQTGPAPPEVVAPPPPPSRFVSLLGYARSLRASSIILFFVAVYVVLVIKIATWERLDTGTLFAIYSITVSAYILSRFALSQFHPHKEDGYDTAYEPTLAFGVPCKNEGEHIYETIMRIARIDYPTAKFEIIAVNDGSTDRTLAEMRRARDDAAKLGVAVQVVNWPVNRGKRAGMAEAVRRTTNDVMVFIDSDSFVTPTTARELVKYFVDPKVGAVAGHAYVANASSNIITKMQAVRYFVAFKAYKASESLFDSVTCCSGCCSAYRRDYLLDFLDRWLEQTFMGVACTYGDDRALTNFLLQRGYKALYADKAISYTIVPDSFGKFMTQQLRWKKSWIRESLKASMFIWKRNPLMSIPYYLGIALPLAAPAVVCRALVWFPVADQSIPWFYLSGLLLMAVIYGLYYHIHTGDRRWIYGSVFAVFYTVVLIWQLPYAMLTLRNARWGTR